MLLSLCLILLLSFLFGFFCKKIKIPSLVGYMAVGVALHALSLIDGEILSVSSQIRRIALILILLRSGLSLSWKDLKRVGRPALLMCFLPATLEILAVGFFAPLLFDVSYRESFLLGSILGAVSPAVVSPRMIEMIEKNQGTKDGVPQLILAGASADDVYAVVMFTAFSSLAVGESIPLLTFAQIPVSVLSGIGAGIAAGICFILIQDKVAIRPVVKGFALLSVCLGLVYIEDTLKGVSSPVAFSGLLACVTAGILLSEKRKDTARQLSAAYNQMWVIAEIFLFVLVGASVDLSYFVSCLPKALLVIAAGLLLRMAGVAVCCIKTKLNGKERLFAAIAYTPKATVQAALIGSLPALLSPDRAGILLSVAVVAILVTAPLGAFAIDLTKNKLVPLSVAYKDCDKGLK